MVTQTTEMEESMANSASETWRSLMIVGGVLAVLGVLAIAFPFATGIGIELLLGGLLVVGGVVHGWHALSARRWAGFFGGVALGVLYVIAGLVLLANPVVGLATLTLLVGAFFLVDGVVELYMGFRVRPGTNWAGLAVSGVLSLVLAGLILAGWPSTAVWAVGLLFGINLLTTGLAMAAVAMGGRRMERAGAGAGTPRPE
ncbi:HdeD family acid-resistance protein [Halalkalicoccus sp. NIPERK01]|uniref:HdeD family acid-resistance protein n=1 Tax=Halalkalicoccus sp. NIPERK01 TaxID=3053469 RepID=UPI00256F3AA1|nr:HdeD family acid-resistance protein [Halalkalicoccus sp. NIPERK01]MDL5361604.1 HdeD family acid-resistance protein [Halalkalicoccus sp. NIPERK01]